MTPSRPADWTALQTLFAEYVAGGSEATRAVFERLERALFPFFRLRIGDDSAAEDLTQATLLKIHFARDRFDPKLSLKTWVFTIAGRCLIDHWRGSDEEHLVRSGGSGEENEEDPMLAVASEELDPAVRAELSGDLGRALEILKPNDRSIVFLSAVEGFSMAEIAQTLGMTESAVKVRAHRAYAKLREKLK